MVQETTEECCNFILDTKPETVRCLIGVDFDVLKQVLAGRQRTDADPVILLKELNDIPTAERLADDILKEMATFARNLWPIWFDNVDFGLGTSSVEQAAARLQIGDAARAIPALSASWGQAALSRCMIGQLPILPQFPLATQLHQLRTAISQRGVVLAISISRASHTDGQLLNFSNVVEWLARNAKISVVVAMPFDLAGRKSLERISFDSLVQEPVVAIKNDKTEFERYAARETDRTWIWLGGGKSHPHSPTEAKLAAALASDPGLCHLFQANRRVTTAYKNEPIVDLLWAEGKVIVEIDGPDHWQPQKYAADRRLDFELLVTGYSVLRLVNDEVMTDISAALAKIREVVSRCGKLNPTT